MKALIFDNKVVDISEAEFEVHNSMTWIDCPDECTTIWTLENNTLTAPPPYVDTRTYAKKRKEEYDKLNQWEMQFDDQRDGTSTWVDSINEIKAKFPKE